MHPTLRDFVRALEAAGELHRVTARVSPILEISAITDRVSKSACAVPSAYASAFDPRHAHLGGKALLFENVEGSGGGGGGAGAGPGAGAAMPVLINAFGSYHRMEMALGCDAAGPFPGGFEALAARLAKLLKPEPPTTFFEKLKRLPELAKLASYPPRVVRAPGLPGPCQEVVKTGAQINLLELPIIKCWPADGDPRAVGWPVDPPPGGGHSGGGRYITFAGVYTIHPDDAGKPADQPRPSRNVGMYRAQVLDATHTAMHWHLHHDGARHWRAWKERFGGKKPMPLALAFGGESVLPYAATAPLPPGVSELLLAGFLNDGPIELVPCQTVDLHVPKNAEVVIEGFVSTEGEGPGLMREDVERSVERRAWSVERESQDASGPSDALRSTLHAPPSGPHALRSTLNALRDFGTGAVLEGPFGDHTGFYSLPDRYPVFTVTAITHRRDPIFPATIVGPPPQEDYYLGKATERLFLPLLRTLIPDILDYHLPLFGCFHNCAFVRIRKEYPLHARRVMHAIWGAGQMSWTKMIVVVDADVNVHDQDAVLFHLAANCDPGRDIEIVNGPLDILDHAAPRLGAGHKIGFDATRKIQGEEVGGHAVRAWPTELVMDEEVRKLVERRWGEYGL